MVGVWGLGFRVVGVCSLGFRVVGVGVWGFIESLGSEARGLGA